MIRVRVEEVIEAPLEVVWAAIDDPVTHVEWMADAAAIRFRTERTRGVGTEIECDTKVGPVTTTDVLRFVEWDPPRRMGITHDGLVTGEGLFTLEPHGGGATRFAWEEELRFPARLGGRAGEVIARPVLAAVWRRNLRRLKRIVESGWTA